MSRPSKAEVEKREKIKKLGLFVKDSSIYAGFEEIAELSKDTPTEISYMFSTACAERSHFLSGSYLEDPDNIEFTKRILDDGQNVRVFSIEYIKGLEFEAVFFIDIDTLENTDLSIKYIYVGVSRANIFLGLTINNEFPEQLKLIKDNFIEGKWTE